MKSLWTAVVTFLLVGCGQVTITTGDSVSSEELQRFFEKHTVDGNRVAAIKKRSFADSYLATVHGYPNNLSVCEELIAPYNKDPSLSGIPGEYFCEEFP